MTADDGDRSSNGADAPRRGNGDDREGYVHRPSGEPPAPTGSRSFDWRGWVLVATVALAFLVVPGALLVLPRAQGLVGSLGLSMRDAYLTLPLVPAIVLGAVAVWSAIRARSP